jgi:hypothetical protein
VGQPGLGGAAPGARHEVEGAKAWKEDDERVLDPEQASTVLSATGAMHGWRHLWREIVRGRR